MDLRTTVKNGVLYLEDSVDKEWNPHFFVLTQNKLFYTDSFHGDEEGEEDGENEEEETQSGFQRPKEVSVEGQLVEILQFYNLLLVR